MRILARKKKAEGSSGGNAPWLNTFADLMNLLLCFFVMIAAYSSVDEEKFEQLAISMANSIGVFDAGGSAVGKGQMISSGMTQLSNLDGLLKSTGQSINGNNVPSSYPNSGSQDNQDGGPNTNQTDSKDKDMGLEEAIQKIEEEKAKLTSEMYDKVSDLREQYNLSGDTELKIDPSYQFVQLDLKGSVLYDSGSADIKKDAEAILNKVGKLLKQFEGYSIEIVGHTDNVPMTSGAFKDNNWLSAARALNATQYLIDKCNIDPATIKYSGRGEYEPVSSNATSEGRARNRRIEIKIYNKYSGR